jgi:adenylate cyclase
LRFTMLSIAYFTLEDYEQSAKWAKLAVERKPDYWMPHTILVASLNLLERQQQARELGQVLLQLYPNISLASLPIEPIRPVEAKRKFYEALALAGIPS